MSPLAVITLPANEALPVLPSYLTMSVITPQAEVAFVMRSMRIISPSVLCLPKRSAAAISLRTISQLAIQFLLIVSALICSPVFTSMAYPIFVTAAGSSFVPSFTK